MGIRLISSAVASAIAIGVLLLHHTIVFPIAIAAVCVVLLFGLVKLFSAFFTMGQISYAAWIILAVKVGCAALLSNIAVNAFLYKREVSDAVKKMRHKI